jgi:hypothetical protein
MSKSNALHIRYIGPDSAREYVVQRGDKMFWDGENWVDSIDSAKKYMAHKTAQVAVASMMSRRHRGKPTRKFKFEMVVTLADEKVRNIPTSTLLAWLRNALRIDIENSVYGDGPTDESYVKARLDLATCKEIQTAENMA